MNARDVEKKFTSPKAEPGQKTERKRQQIGLWGKVRSSPSAREKGKKIVHQRCEKKQSTPRKTGRRRTSEEKRQEQQ